MMRALYRLRLLVILVIQIGTLAAQVPANEEEDLKFALPPSWKGFVLDPSDPTSQEKNGGELRNLKVLLYARPEDGRAASVSIVRETNTRNPFVDEDIAIRLKEMAATQGYRVGSLSALPKSKGFWGSFFAEIVGTNEAGHSRIFVAVAVCDMKTPVYRCFWQADAEDSMIRADFQHWLGSLIFQGKSVATAFTGSTNSLVLQEPKPGDAPAPGEVAGQSAAKPPPISLEVAEFVKKNRDSLVLIQGARGVGSGFVCKIDGKPTVLTNAHVLAGNPQPEFFTMDGTSLTPTAASLAAGRDICRLGVIAAGTQLELLPGIDATVRIGDPVAVLGNAEGAGVVKPLVGKVVGVGPELVEVDAPFVPGNSGSPIIHVPTAKVIGIATYLLIRRVDDASGNVDSTVRRFGYRLDNVRAWEPVDWPRFYAQSAQLEKIETTGKEFIKLFESARANTLSPVHFSNPGIRRALENFGRTMRGSRMSEADRSNARRLLLGELRAASMSDISTFDNRTAYDYFRRTVADEKKLREEIYSAFTRAIESGNR